VLLIASPPPTRRTRPEPAVAGWSGLERLCLDALAREAAAWPKPGLVSPVDAGSHCDMDYGSFVASIASLQGYFTAIAAAGARHADFAALQRLGVAAEARMLAATGGANTHRGAIFNLGLLAAAAALRTRDPGFAAASCGDIVTRRWGDAILAARPAAPAFCGTVSHGNTVFRRHAAGGAREEAAGGFASVYQVGLPALRRLLDAGLAAERALVGTLLALIAALTDTNLLWRGGETALAWAQAAAREFNGAGGVMRSDWRARLAILHDAFVGRNLSPGGAADLVAATWVVHHLEAGRGAW